MAVRNVAIIGGGIGGLSVAFFLQGLRSANGRDTYQCTVFEKTGHLGGNAYTAYQGARYRNPFADLAVNDFNLATYRIMGEVLDQLAAQGFPVQTGALTDEACFFTTALDVAAGFPDVSFTTRELADPRTDVTRAIARDKEKFEKLALQIMRDPDYATKSVGQFLALPQFGFSDAFRDYYIFPRINGMYFMGETVPADMPLRGVMSYYILQEGIGLPPDRPSNRRFFSNGSSDWILQLRNALQKRGTEFRMNESPRVLLTGDPPKMHVSSSKGDRFPWDHAVVAVYADEVVDVVPVGLPILMPAMLGEFRYINSIAIAHTYDAVMPPMDRRQTYNIRIHPRDTRMLRPYTISYVEKMHQGAPTPEGSWFVSENPPVPIPDGRILDMIDLDSPENDPRTRKAVAYFRHNTVTTGTIMAQRFLAAMQGENQVYFTGGWTQGAGLHEEILGVSQDVASKIRGYLTGGPLHSYRDDDPNHVPRYFLDALTTENAEVFPAGFWE